MEIQRTVGSAIEPGAVDDVGHLPLYDRREHVRPVVWIVFEVGVLNDDDIARDARQAGSDRGAFASVALVKEDCEGNIGNVLRAVGGEFELAAAIQPQAAPASPRLAEVFSQPVRGAVAGSVIDDDDLPGNHS